MRRSSRGDVVKSQEVNAWFVLACATLTLMMFSGSMSHGITTTLRGFIANSYAIWVDGNGFLGLVSKLGNEVIAAMAMPFLLLALAAVGGNLVQHPSRVVDGIAQAQALEDFTGRRL